MITRYQAHGETFVILFDDWRRARMQITRLVFDKRYRFNWWDCYKWSQLLTEEQRIRMRGGCANS